MAGITDIVSFDVYVDNRNQVLGIIALYRYAKDADQALWMAWFYVHPLVRGQGIKQALSPTP